MRGVSVLLLQILGDIPFGEVKSGPDVIPFHTPEALVVGTKSLGGVEEHVRLLPVNNPMEGRMDLLSFVLIERQSQFLDQGIRLDIAEGDMVAAPFLLARLGSMPDLERITLQRLGPAKPDDIELLALHLVDKGGPFQVADVHRDPGILEGFLDHGCLVLHDRVAAWHQVFKLEFPAVLVQHAIPIGVNPSGVGQQIPGNFRVVAYWLDIMVIARAKEILASRDLPIARVEPRAALVSKAAVRIHF